MQRIFALSTGQRDERAYFPRQSDGVSFHLIPNSSEKKADKMLLAKNKWDKLASSGISWRPCSEAIIESNVDINITLQYNSLFASRKIRKNLFIAIVLSWKDFESKKTDLHSSNSFLQDKKILQSGPLIQSLSLLQMKIIIFVSA